MYGQRFNRRYPPIVEMKGRMSIWEKRKHFFLVVEISTCAFATWNTSYTELSLMRLNKEDSKNVTRLPRKIQQHFG